MPSSHSCHDHWTASLCSGPDSKRPATTTNSEGTQNISLWLRALIFENWTLSAAIVIYLNVGCFSSKCLHVLSHFHRSPSFIFPHKKMTKQLVPFQTNVRRLYAGMSACNAPLLFPKVAFGVARAAWNCTLWISALVLPHVRHSSNSSHTVTAYVLGAGGEPVQRAKNPARGGWAGIQKRCGSLAHDSGSWDETFFSKSVACNIECGRWSVFIDTVWYLIFFFLIYRLVIKE